MAALLSLIMWLPAEAPPAPAAAAAAAAAAPRDVSCELERCDEGDSSRSGMWLRLRFSTTDWGRTLRATERRFVGKCGVACDEGQGIHLAIFLKGNIYIQFEVMFIHEFVMCEMMRAGGGGAGSGSDQVFDFW